MSRTLGKKRRYKKRRYRKRRYRKRRYRKQRGKEFPIGLLASAAAPILGEVAKSILKKKFWW